MRNYYVSGDWNAICDRCGFKYKASALREEWTGSRVCSHCWEPRHPQTLIRVREDNPATPWARPEAADVFITGGPGSFITIESGDTEQFYWILTESGLPLLTET